jgi:hypothetical protein
MVNLQNQLEASLSSALVAAINSQDVAVCRRFSRSSNANMSFETTTTGLRERLSWRCGKMPTCWTATPPPRPLPLAQLFLTSSQSSTLPSCHSSTPNERPSLPYSQIPTHSFRLNNVRPVGPAAHIYTEIYPALQSLRRVRFDPSDCLLQGNRGIRSCCGQSDGEDQIRSHSLFTHRRLQCRQHVGTEAFTSAVEPHVHVLTSGYEPFFNQRSQCTPIVPGWP